MFREGWRIDLRFNSKSGLFWLFGISLLFAGPAMAGEEKEDRRVTVASPPSYTVRKILLFPLEMPAYAVRGATYPLYQTLDWSDRNRIPQKIHELLSNEAKTFSVFPILETGFGSGFGGGLHLRHTNVFDEDYRFGFTGEVYTNSSYKLHGNLTSRPLFLFDRPFQFTVSSEWNRYVNRRLGEIGNESDPDTEGDYGRASFDGIVSADWRPFSSVHLLPGLGVAYGKTFSASINNPAVEDVFPAPVLAGFDRQITYLAAELTIAHDTRDASSPERGGLRSFRFRRLQDLVNGEFSYNEYFLDLRQIIPLGKPRFALLLRNAWLFQQETGDSQIPFDRLAFLDVNTPLRAFDAGRFRDHGLVIFNAEYRYPVWDMIDGTIFLDAGRVFDDIGDFAFRNFKYSAGGGIHIVTQGAIRFRIQAAYGNEGANVLFSAGSAL